MNRSKIKYLFIVTVTALLLISCGKQPKQNNELRIVIEVDPVQEVVKPVLIVTEEQIVGTWSSTLKTRNGVQAECLDTQRITFRPNHTFKSYCKPTNHKTGSWRLSAENVIWLHMKASDGYEILEISDTTLTANLTFTSDTIIMQYRKRY